MDILSIAGLVLALIAIIGGSIAKGAGLSALWNFAAFLIVIVGTLGAVLLQSGLPTFKRAMKIARWIVQPPPDNRRKLIAQVVAWAGIARKQGGRLAKTHVHRGLATAQHVVVHAGHVIVHQRVGVDQLHRAGRTQARLRQATDRFARGQGQQRAQALAAIEHGVAHGLGQAGGHPLVRSHPALERVLHPGQLHRGPGAQLEGGRQVGRGKLGAQTGS